MNARAAFASRILGAVVFAVCTYLVLPTLAVVPVSFTASDYITFPPEGFSLRWYQAFVGEGAWRDATITSVVIALFSTIAATVIGTWAALGLSRLSGTLGACRHLVLPAADDRAEHHHRRRPLQQLRQARHRWHEIRARRC